MSYETPDIEFSKSGQIDENLAYSHAAVVHAALEKMAVLETGLPSRLVRPFKANDVADVSQRVHNTAKKAGREFELIQEVVEANRGQGQVLSYLFDYPAAEDYDLDVVAQAQAELDRREIDSSVKIAQVIQDVYSRDQSDTLQLTTFHVFDSLSPVRQPSGKVIRRTLEELGFDELSDGPQFRAYNQRGEAGNLEAHTTIFPRIEAFGGYIDQAERSITAHYSQHGPDVSVSVIVAVQAEQSQVS